MNNLQQIVRILNPAFRGLPIIIGIMVVMIFIATRINKYSTPMYECTGRIKLEDPNLDISNTNLFKTFDVFSNPSKIMAEVEVLKSPEMLKAALENIPFDVSYYREGKIRTSELFYDAPFHVSYTITDDKLFDKHFTVSLKDTSFYQLEYTLDDKAFVKKCRFGEVIAISGAQFILTFNKELFKTKPNFDLTGNYYFVVNDKIKQIEELEKQINVKELDKEIPVIRIIISNPVPEKAMLLTNTLMETYIEEGIRLKTGAAKKTVNFIDKQLVDISAKLAQSELELEKYRTKNKVTNTKLEVETDLKKVAQLKIQLTNVEMNLASLDTLDAYINEGHDDFLDKAANYEGYGGLLYTELMKRLKNLQADKKELLLKYTPDNDKVKVVDSNIADVVNYIKQNIHNARNSMKIQRNKIAGDIQLAEIPFESIPGKEKQIVILEREFRLNQEIYNFLNEKRTEANIAQAATFSFHRIIQKATLPTKPFSPKKTFTIIVFSFLGLLLSLALIYIYDAISSRIKYKDQLEKGSTCAVIADIRHEKIKGQATQDFLSLGSKLVLGHHQAQIISITSSIDSEGKSFIASRLAQALADMQIPVLLVAANLRDRTIGTDYAMEKRKGFSEFISDETEDGTYFYKVNDKSNFYIMPEGESNFIPEAIFANPLLDERLLALKEKFKVVIIDLPSFDTALDALALAKLSDLVLYVFRANYSKTKMILDPDLLKQEYALENIRLVLNDVEDFAKMKKDNGIRKGLSNLLRRISIAFRRKFK